MSKLSTRAQSVMDPTVMRLAGEYARGLLECIPQDDQAESLADELTQLLETLQAIEGFSSLLARWQMSGAGAEHMVERTFAGRVSKPLEALLVLLARNGRLGILPPVVRAFGEQLDAREGKVKVTLTTAVPVPDAQRPSLLAAVQKAIGAKAAVKMRVDKNLLGGVVLQVGDVRYDASVAGDLAKLRDQILSGTGPTGQ